MKGALINLCLMVCFAAGIARAEAPFEDGLKPAQLAQIAQMLPPTSISSIRFFREIDNGRLSAAILTESKRSGWQILLISPQGRAGDHPSWISPRSPDSFAVSSPTTFATYGLADEEAIVFSGCAPHMCPEIFSALLCVPTRHRAFVATCNRGQTSFSFSVTADLEEYKEALAEVLRKIDGHGSGHACSSESQEKR